MIICKFALNTHNMKIKFLLFIFSVIILSACSKSTDRTLLGKWNASDNGYYIVNSIFVSDTLDTSKYGTMTFRQDGGGTFVHDDLREDIEWKVNQALITLKIGSTNSRTFNIILDASEYQTWTYEKEISDTTNGLDSKEEWISLFKLSRIKSDL
jgi:hypothetical protein